MIARQLGSGYKHATVKNTEATMTMLDDGRYAANMPANPTNQPTAPQLLVIDDSEVHRIIICKIAIKAGFVTMEAENCGDVVRLTTLNKFEGATLDLSLGERAGTEVLRHFAICKFRAPIIILSGANPEVTRNAYELGQSLDLNMLEPIGKPADLAALREMLTTMARDWQAQLQVQLPAA
jgi:CheY-like chemotaxis protein